MIQDSVHQRSRSTVLRILTHPIHFQQNQVRINYGIACADISLGRTSGYRNATEIGQLTLYRQPVCMPWCTGPILRPSGPTPWTFNPALPFYPKTPTHFSYRPPFKWSDSPHPVGSIHRGYAPPPITPRVQGRGGAVRVPAARGQVKGAEARPDIRVKWSLLSRLLPLYTFYQVPPPPPPRVHRIRIRICLSAS